MKALLTGASGFLGKIISQNCSFDITTLGRHHKNDILADLSITIPVLKDRFDIIIHAAGKAHFMQKHQLEKPDFNETNVVGTTNLLKGLERVGLPKTFLYISSVSVYGAEMGMNITEEHPLMAKDEYGRSKIEAERLIQLWCRNNNVICTILRLPLVAGPNPPGNLKAMINAIKKGYYFNIAGGEAQKSMVLAVDVAKILPVVAEIGGIFNLTDMCHPNFKDLSFNIANQLEQNKPISVPYAVSKIIAYIGDLFVDKLPFNSKVLLKITSNLTFDDTKAVKTFGWNPTPVLEGFKII